MVFGETARRHFFWTLLPSTRCAENTLTSPPLSLCSLSIQSDINTESPSTAAGDSVPVRAAAAAAAGVVVLCGLLVRDGRRAPGAGSNPVAAATVRDGRRPLEAGSDTKAVAVPSDTGKATATAMGIASAVAVEIVVAGYTAVAVTGSGSALGAAAAAAAAVPLPACAPPAETGRDTPCCCCCCCSPLTSLEAPGSVTTPPWVALTPCKI